MLNQNVFIVEEVRRRIKKEYPVLDVLVYYEATKDNYIIAIKEDAVYYSHDFLSLISEIKLEYLWKNQIFNYLFVCENEPCCGTLLLKSVSPLRSNFAQYNVWTIEEIKVHAVKSDLQASPDLGMAA